MKGQGAWFFGILFLFLAIPFAFAMFPVMQNVINAAAPTLPASVIALGGLLPLFTIIGIAIIFWKITAG